MRKKNSRITEGGERGNGPARKRLSFDPKVTENFDQEREKGSIEARGGRQGSKVETGNSNPVPQNTVNFDFS